MASKNIKISTTDAILLAVSFVGFGLLSLILYRLTKVGKRRSIEDLQNVENNRAARRRRQIANRRNNRRRAGIENENENNAVNEEEEEKVQDDTGLEHDDMIDVNDNNNEEDVVNVKALTRKERAKAEKKAFKEEKRRRTEQRREELRQKKEQEEQAYLERRELVREEMQRERKALQRTEQDIIKKQNREYEYWKKTFEIIETGEGSSFDMDKFVDFVNENPILELKCAAKEFGLSMNEARCTLQKLIERKVFIGNFDQKDRFVHFSKEEISKIVQVAEEKGCISLEAILTEF